MVSGYDKDPNYAGGRITAGTWFRTAVGTALIALFVAGMCGLIEIASLLRGRNLYDLF